MSNDTCYVDGCTERHNGRGHPDPVQRFWSYVDRTGPGGCWIWTGTLEPSGYARFRDNYTRTGVHRYAYELLVGQIPDGLQLDHLCKVRHCVNPDHLEQVTGAENTRRREDLRGSAHGCAVLTESDVRSILYELRHHSYHGIGVDLAARYGVTKMTISAIKHGRLWKHIPREE